MQYIQRIFSRDKVREAGEASIRDYRELYKKLDAYDKGELPKAKNLANGKDLQKLIQSFEK